MSGASNWAVSLESLKTHANCMPHRTIYLSLTSCQSTSKIMKYCQSFNPFHEYVNWHPSSSMRIRYIPLFTERIIILLSYLFLFLFDKVLHANPKSLFMCYYLLEAPESVKRMQPRILEPLLKERESREYNLEYYFLIFYSGSVDDSQKLFFQCSHSLIQQGLNRYLLSARNW